MADDRIKSPAFQFYPKDFLTDDKQIAMSIAEAGIYIRLLCHCWLRGSIPEDPKVLARMSGATSRQIKELWPALAPCFKPTGDGNFIHPRLERERDKQVMYRQEQSAKGKASAAARANRASTEPQPASNRGSTVVAIRLQPESKSSSPSAVSDLPSPEKKHALPTDLDARWEEFKAKYPGKGRDQSYASNQAFMVGCETVGVEVVMAGLERYIASKNVRDGYVMGMRKWLEDGLWIREPEPADKTSGDVAAMAEHLARMDAEKAARGR